MSTDQQFPTPANLGIAVYSNNAEAIGNTPLVRINRLIKTGATVLAKVESRNPCLLYTSDAADDSLRVDLGGRRIIKKRPTGVACS